jgi:hypothetical protein
MLPSWAKRGDATARVAIATMIMGFFTRYS